MIKANKSLKKQSGTSNYFIEKINVGKKDTWSNNNIAKKFQEMIDSYYLIIRKEWLLTLAIISFPEYNKSVAEKSKM